MAVSIGSKFNILALGIPIAGLLILLVGGFLALDGVVWNRLRSQLDTKMHEVWDSYLKPIRDEGFLYNLESDPTIRP